MTEGQPGTGSSGSADADLVRILFGQAAFQYLRAGCELGLFTLLEAEPGCPRERVAAALGLEERALDILLLGTSALGLVQRADGGFRNGPSVARLFAEGRWETFEAVVGFEAHIVYPGLTDFTESLRENTNVGLRRIPGTGGDLYRRLTESPELSDVFRRFMHAWSDMSSGYLVSSVDFGSVSRLLDVGGGDGVNAIAIARRFPHLRATVVDLPAVAPLAEKRVAEAGLTDRIDVVALDMFAEPFPPGHDCVLFAHQMQIWTLEEDVALLRRAHEALPPGGTVVIFNSMSNDSGDGPLMAALDSAYFAALPTTGGMIYPWHKLEGCLTRAGFTGIERLPCEGAWSPHGVLVGRR